MGKMRVLSLASLMLASSMLTGCWGDSWCCGGCKKSEPLASKTPPAPQNPPVTTGALPQQQNGWNDRTAAQGTRLPGMQDSNVNSTITPARSPLTAGDTGTSTRTPATTTIMPTGASQVDPAMSLNPAPARPAVPAAGLNDQGNTSRLTPLQPMQRDSSSSSNIVTASQPPAGTLPPPPAPLPPVGPPQANTSNYQTLPPTPSQLPPLDPVPAGQSKIPVLPKGGPGSVE
jgi:hypothetical protein